MDGRIRQGRNSSDTVTAVATAIRGCCRRAFCSSILIVAEVVRRRAHCCGRLNSVAGRRRYCPDLRGSDWRCLDIHGQFCNGWLFCGRLSFTMMGLDPKKNIMRAAPGGLPNEAQDNQCCYLSKKGRRDAIVRDIDNLFIAWQYFMPERECWRRKIARQYKKIWFER